MQDLFHSKITYPFPQKSRESALKLTDLWITSLLWPNQEPKFMPSLSTAKAAAPI